MQRDQMEQYAKMVNGLKADMIAVTGDFVNSSVQEVYPFATAFSLLHAQDGVYGVLGNHDYYTRQVETVAKEVSDCGIRLLRNEHLVIERNGHGVCLVGVDDVGTRKRAGNYFDQALLDSKSGMTRILLCHRPYFFDEAKARDIDLTLSGHTHGGQIVFVRLGNDIIAPARIASPYVAGLYSQGRSHMYVSRGVGTVGVPIRINCPPEITKIVLKRSGQ
jgi:predicted MPP superfamily phosphohydrolase